MTDRDRSRRVSTPLRSVVFVLVTWFGVAHVSTVRAQNDAGTNPSPSTQQADPTAGDTVADPSGEQDGEDQDASSGEASVVESTMTSITDTGAAPDLETVRAAKAALEGAGSLTADQKVELEIISATESFLLERDRLLEEAKEFQRQEQAVPAEAAAIQQALNRPATHSELEEELAKGLPSSELKTRLDAARAELERFRQERDQVEKIPTQRSVRREAIPVERESILQRQSELTVGTTPDTTPDATPDDVDRIPRLQADRRRAELAALSARLERLTRELANYDARKDLLRQKRQLFERRVIDSTAIVGMLERALAEAESAEAKDLVRRATNELEAARAHGDPILIQIAEENLAIANRIATRANEINDQSATRQSMSQINDQWQRKFQNMNEKVARVGFTDAIGISLRRMRSELPSIRLHERQLDERGRRMNAYEFERAEYEDRQLMLVQIDNEVRDRVGSSTQPFDGVPDEQRRGDIAQALRLQRDVYLTDVLSTYDRLLDVLVPTQEAEQSLVNTVILVRDFIDERVLWIQSTQRLSMSTLRDAANASRWMVSSFVAPDTQRLLIEDLWKHKIEYGLIAALSIGLLFARRRVRRQIKSLSVEARHKIRAEFGHTIRAVLLTLVLALSLSAPIWLLGVMLSNVGSSQATIAEGGTFVSAVGSGLRYAGILLFVALFIRELSRVDGVGDAHFRWRSSSMALIRRHLRWYVPVAAIAIGVIVLLEQQSATIYRDSLGRLVFIGHALAVTFLLFRVMRPDRGLPKHFLDRHRGGWLDRLRLVWFALILAVPTGLAIAAALGWYYTATELQLQIFRTILFAVVLIVAHGLATRWLFLTQRNMALAQARKKREEMLKARAAGETEETTTPLIKEESISVAEISAQSRSLMQNAVLFVAVAGLLFVWGNVLPAFGVLDEVKLWSQTVTMSESIENADGTTTVESVMRIVPITLANIGMSLLILIVTTVVSRNVGGLLNLTILQRLPITPSGRYAVTSVSQYAVVIIGLVAAFNAIGIGWSTVQWLAAAITVGLGFGLQEIFANFVSGLIILFERPVRIGDTVSVGEVSGTVTRIRMRATTVTNWDRKELIVPNKEFVTNQVINWSLSDTVIRLSVTVGIAYGSDTEKATELLLQAAHECPHTIEDPASSVTFEAFGDSSLQFTLRTFLPTVDCILLARHDVHSRIDRLFRDAHIEIAFPQQDLHLRTVDGGIIAAMPRERGGIPVGQS